MTLDKLIDTFSTEIDDEINKYLCQFLSRYAPSFTAQGYPDVGVQGILTGIAVTLQIINEHGIPSDLQEIMDDTFCHCRHRP